MNSLGTFLIVLGVGLFSVAAFTWSFPIFVGSLVIFGAGTVCLEDENV
jgi:hypothetical protein